MRAIFSGGTRSHRSRDAARGGTRWSRLTLVPPACHDDGMSKLKVALSILALLVMAAGGVTSFGNWMVPPAISEILLAIGGAMATAGFQPFTVPPALARLCTTIGYGLSLFVVSHAATWGDGQRHVWIVVLAFGGALLGVLGRGLTSRPAQPAGGDPPPAPAPSV
jgi:hypothetical protein